VAYVTGLTVGVTYQRDCYMSWSRATSRLVHARVLCQMQSSYSSVI